MNEVYMDTDRVLDMANSFGRMGSTLDAVDKTLEAAMQVLETTAFIGLVGGAVWARFIGMIRPQIRDLAEFCNEIDRDLKAAVEAFIRGDEQGATRFY